MNRRTFLALASGLLAPVPEPVKRYFFAPAGGWQSVTLTGNWTRTLAMYGHRETITLRRHEDDGGVLVMDEATWRKVSAAAQTIDGVQLSPSTLVRVADQTNITDGVWRLEPREAS